jgi:hypothetical protein
LVLLLLIQVFLYWHLSIHDWQVSFKTFIPPKRFI